MNRRRGADVEDAAMNPFPLRNILRPTVLGPRHNAEHVLHAQRDSCPMVRFHFGHGLQRSRTQARLEAAANDRAGVVRPCGHFDQYVAVQINEGELLPA